jgi:aromatic ring-opening dioxygenase catalytic subunit (LigB family)
MQNSKNPPAVQKKLQVQQYKMAQQKHIRRQTKDHGSLSPIRYAMAEKKTDILAVM